MDPFKHLRLPWVITAAFMNCQKYAFGGQSGLRVVLHFSKLTGMQYYVNYQLRYKYWRQWNKTRWPVGGYKSHTLHTQKTSQKQRKHRPVKVYPEHRRESIQINPRTIVLCTLSLSFSIFKQPLSNFVSSENTLVASASLPNTLPVLLSPRLDLEFTPSSVRQDVMLHAGPADPVSPSSLGGEFWFKAWIRYKKIM